eukprot:6203883-Pleurochrysis_carterae.AAC.1
MPQKSSAEEAWVSWIALHAPSEEDSYISYTEYEARDNGSMDSSFQLEHSHHRPASYSALEFGAFDFE